jgi:hypothetical protein
MRKNMPFSSPLFPELREILVQFRKSSPTERRKLLAEWQENISNLPTSIYTEGEARQAYTRMAYAATLTNYANALWRIEHREYFDILIDFYSLPSTINEDLNKFGMLNNFFEFHPSQPQVRLTKPLSEISEDIWNLFTEAQKAHLRGRSRLFNLDDIKDHDHSDQLYPLPQMFGKYNNEAVDRVFAQKGKIRFAFKFGAYQLPGGGMVEIDKVKNEPEMYIRKMLDEHLEEEHGQLYLAVDIYNGLESNNFKDKILEQLVDKKYGQLFAGSNLQNQLIEVLSSENSNSEMLKGLIKLLDDFKCSDSPQEMNLQKRLIRELKAGLQVETFKLHGVYQEAVEYLKESTTSFSIEQVGDVRAWGGKQTSIAFILRGGQSLQDWLREKLGVDTHKFADDLKGAQAQDLTLLEALAKFRSIRFSHILIALAHHLECFKKNTLEFDKVWDSTQYRDAKGALQQGLKEEISKIDIAAQEIANQRTLYIPAEAISNPLSILLPQSPQQRDVGQPEAPELIIINHSEGNQRSRPSNRASTIVENVLIKLQDEVIPSLCKSSETKSAAQELLNDLTTLQTNYDLSDPQQESQFREECSSAIRQVKPILAKDLNWGPYFQNLLKVLANGVITVFSCGNASRNAFFKPAVAPAYEALRVFRKDLKSSPEGDPSIPMK